MTDTRDSQEDHEDQVRYNVQMPKRLRDDAKRNSARGELAEAVRDVFRRKAYGCSSQGPTESEQLQAELRDIRAHIDQLRAERDKTNAEIQAQENRANRLEERVSAVQSDLATAIDDLEPELQNGQRMWPTYIKNEVGCSAARADELCELLKQRNPDLPDTAFLEPGIHDPVDWRDAR